MRGYYQTRLEGWVVWFVVGVLFIYARVVCPEWDGGVGKRGDVSAVREERRWQGDRRSSNCTRGDHRCVVKELETPED